MLRHVDHVDLGSTDGVQGSLISSRAEAWFKRVIRFLEERGSWILLPIMAVLKTCPSSITFHSISHYYLWLLFVVLFHSVVQSRWAQPMREEIERFQLCSLLWLCNTICSYRRNLTLCHLLPPFAVPLSWTWRNAYAYPWLVSEQRDVVWGFGIFGDFFGLHLNEFWQSLGHFNYFNCFAGQKHVQISSFISGSRLLL